MTQTLLLVRHGEVEGAFPGMLLGSSDLGLSDAGRGQAVRLREALPVEEATRFVCSPLARARETAVLALAGVESGGKVEVDGRLEVDPDLREVDFGEWERRSFEELGREQPALVEAWSQFRPDFGFPGGEKLVDFAARIERAAGRLAAGGAETVIAFTHGGVIRALICHFLGLPLRHYLLFDITPASVTTLRLWEGRGVLVGLRPGEDFSGRQQGWVWRR
jgi:broad specificity phosphatase PhoE